MIIWVGGIANTSSYAESARRILPLLPTAGILPTEPPNTVLWHDDTITDLYHRVIPGDPRQILQAPMTTPIYHMVPGLLTDLPPGWVYSGWDATPYPTSWVTQLNQQKGFLTWSEWSAHIARESGVTVPIHVLPIPYDPPAVSPPPRLAGTVFGMVSQFVPRKMLMEAIEWFWQTFTENDDVALIVKGFPSPVQTDPMIWRDLHFRKRSYRIPPTYVWTGAWTPQEMAAFYTGLDVLIHPSRGEGYGMPHLEAAMHQTALIIPEGAGGYEDWVPPEGAWRIPTHLEPVSAGGIPDWQEPGMQWWVTKPDDWRQALWEASQHPDIRQQKAIQAQEAALQHGSSERIKQSWSALWPQLDGAIVSVR